MAATVSDYVGMGGAAISLGGMAAGMMAKGPEPVNVNYPELTNIEKAMMGKQIEITQGLLKQINDPNIKSRIVSLLPDEGMTAEQRAWKATEYAKIKKQVVSTSLQQANQIYGKDAWEEGRRIGLSDEQIQSQIDKNTAATTAIANIFNKRLDASREKIARSQYLRGAGQDIKEAGILANIDESSRRIFNQTVNAGLQSSLRRGENIQGLQSTLAKTNLSNVLETSGTKTEFGLQNFLKASESGFGMLAQSQENKKIAELAAKYPKTFTPEIMELLKLRYGKTSLFGGKNTYLKAFGESS